MTDTTIGEGTRISLHFSLALEDGQTVDSTFGKAPASFEFGDGNLPAGFERYLRGLRAGDRKRFQVPPEDAFGQPNPNNIQTFPREHFSPDLELEPGLVVSFADASRAELPGVIQSIEEDQVQVDFNHPLAGQTLWFEVEILDVQPATPPPH